MPNIKPFRQYDEADVLNFFACDTVPAPKGTFVTPSVGFKNDDNTVDMIGAIGNSYLGTVSQRYGVTPRVITAVSGNKLLGLLLHDVKETDENGELLKFNPRKAAEMQVAISGQAVPILKRGLILYSGISGSPAAGGDIYFNDQATDGSLATVGTNKVGQAFGTKDAAGYTFVYISV